MRERREGTVRTPLHILLVDPCKQDRESCRRLIASRFEQDHAIVEAGSSEEALAQIEADEPHCVVLDHRLPELDGLAFLLALRAAHGENAVPVVMLTGNGSEQVAVEAMKCGAQDYLPKATLCAESLHRAICGAMKQVAAQQKLRRSASTDDLTGTCNRRSLMERLREEVERSRRHRTPLSLLMLDLDHFKRVNDRFGHRVGDAVLENVGRLLQATLRAGDFAGRYGGEEFCIVLTDTPLTGAEVAAERIRRQVSMLAVQGPSGVVVRVTCSIGAAQVGAGRDAAEAIDLADRALYAAKAAGRDRVELARPPIAVASPA